LSTPIRDHELRTLVEQATTPAVSIYAPMAKAGPDTRQNATRFKNLVREAADRLDVERPGDDPLLGPLYAKIDDHDFWQHQEQGLAVFRSGDALRWVKLPIETPAEVTVADTFRVAPILALLASNQAFDVLTLSLGEVRLFECDRFVMQPQELPAGAPRRLEDAVGYDSPRANLQFHSAGRGGNRPIYHGHSAEPSPDAEVKQLFGRLAAALGPFLDVRVPLVLAGQPHLQARFREVAHLPQLLPEGVDLGVESMNEDELHGQAWSVVEAAVRAQRRDRPLQRLSGLVAHGRAVTGVDDVVPAAVEGRVDTLLVDPEVHRLGRIDPTTHRVSFAAEGEAVEDLVERAARETWLNGGQVISVPEELLGPDAPVAAVLRY
jgi:hypothetical protein